MEKQDLSNQSTVPKLPNITVVKQIDCPLIQDYKPYSIYRGAENSSWDQIIKEALSENTTCCFLPSIYNFVDSNSLQNIVEFFIHEDWYADNRPLIIYSDVIINNEHFSEYYYMPTASSEGWDAEQLITIPLMIHNCDKINDIENLTLKDIVSRILNIHIPKALFHGNS